MNSDLILHNGETLSDELLGYYTWLQALGLLDTLAIHQVIAVVMRGTNTLAYFDFTDTWKQGKIPI